MEFGNIRDTEHAGIVIIHQELALIPLLSITENIFLGNEDAKRGVIDWHDARKRAVELLARVGLDENPDTIIRDIGIGKQQLVEIAKALSKDVKLLILDEPTAALNEDDCQHLLEPARRPARPRHHLDHDQPQAQRDRADRRRHHDHPRRPDHRDAPGERRRRRRGPDHPRHGRPRPRPPLPAARVRPRRGAPRDPRLDRHAPRRPAPRRRRQRQPHGAPRRDRRARRA